ncbi:hypothetical protein SAMN04515660_1821 [Luteibacter sp. 329MFSha]|nr:hypothetical protein SAMN04515660_1821 [Luteibacter sp. 329MFSha]
MAGMLLVAMAYLPGISGNWLFDDYPNIVDNKAVQPKDATIASLSAAALSSPSSDFKRPLASLSFAANYLLSGLDPAAMKLTNIAIHLANGLLVFLLARLLLAGGGRVPDRRDGMHAALVATLWMALPINLTAVLYVVQRMESLANLFVLAGLVGYMIGRRRMLAGRRGLLLAAGSLVVATAIGVLAKETAILTVVYALLIETFVFRWRESIDGTQGVSRRTVALFVIVLVIPLLIGGSILVPRLLADATWAPRSFTLRERLLSECRIVASYLRWTLLPTPSGLSFYHDDFVVSKGWLTPWTTLASAAFLVTLAGAAIAVRRRWPLVSLGIGWFFACHALTATIIPLELIYEHRNYFASLGVVLALVTVVRADTDPDRTARTNRRVRPRDFLLCIVGAYWLGLTAFTAYRWGGDPLRLPEELAIRNPASPRAQYELGRAYVIMTGYKTDSPYRAPAYRVLERASATPGASTLPEQALIFLNGRMRVPVEDAWWESMRRKLEQGPVSIEDESAIMSLATCQIDGTCDLDPHRLLDLYIAALSHPKPRARLVGSYSDFAWTTLGDRQLGYSMAKEAASIEPDEPAYHVTVARQAIAMGDLATARTHIAALARLNVGDRLGTTLSKLKAQLATAEAAAGERVPTDDSASMNGEPRRPTSSP